MFGYIFTLNYTEGNEKKGYFMLVFNIMKKVIQDDSARKKATVKHHITQNGNGLGGLNFEIGEMQNHNLPLTIKGELPSLTSISLRYLADTTLGYMAGKAMYGNEATEQGYGAPSSWLQTSSATVGSGVVALTLDHYLFSKYFGVDIGATVLNLPIRGEDESDDEYRARRDSWVESLKNTPDFIQHLDTLSTKATNSLQAEFFFWSALALAKAYHGYQRHNQSIGMMLGWALFGNLGLAVSQGFAKPTNNKKEN